MRDITVPSVSVRFFASKKLLWGSNSFLMIFLLYNSFSVSSHFDIVDFHLPFLSITDRKILSNSQQNLATPSPQESSTQRVKRSHPDLPCSRFPNQLLQPFAHLIRSFVGKCN